MGMTSSPLPACRLAESNAADEWLSNASDAPAPRGDDAPLLCPSGLPHPGPPPPSLSASHPPDADTRAPGVISMMYPLRPSLRQYGCGAPGMGPKETYAASEPPGPLRRSVAWPVMSPRASDRLSTPVSLDVRSRVQKMALIQNAFTAHA